MMFFGLIVMIALLSAAALLVIPAMRTAPKTAITTRDELNKAIYHDRLSELAEEETQGITEQSLELTNELQQNLLAEFPPKKDQHRAPVLPSPTPPTQRWALLFGCILLLVVSVGLYLKIGGLDQVLAWQARQ